MDVSRYTNTKELRFTIEFVTPCFLGGADGNAEVRTAPFKNLLRRWWRIVNGNLQTEELWKQEAELFGSKEKNADTNKIFGKSKVVLQIIDSKFQIQNDRNLRFGNKTIKHKEVSNTIPFETYLGMGPIFWNKQKGKSEYKFFPILEYCPEIKDFDKRAGKEKIIKSERKSYVSFLLKIPGDKEDCFLKILSYIHYFGTIGSRSRNGWGSLFVEDISCNAEKKELLKPKELKDSAVDWDVILENEKKYPSSIAKDENGLLCWCAPQRNFWEDAMLDAAKIYSELRTNFTFNMCDFDDKKKFHKSLQSRHILGYPVTNHDYKEWGKDVRLPSQLCMKINFNQGKYRVQITHIPNLLPLPKIPSNNQDLPLDTQKQIQIWTQVHNFLDNYEIKNDKGEIKKLSRFGGAL